MKENLQQVGKISPHNELIQARSKDRMSFLLQYLGGQSFHDRIITLTIPH